MMPIVGLIDLATFIALLVAMVAIVSTRKHVLPKDTMLLLWGIAIVSLLHALSNTLEWAGITSALDPLEDYFQIVEPLLWFFFAVSFLRSRDIEVLRESEERYRALYEDLPDAVFLADAGRGVIVGANRAAERLLARPLAEIIGMHQSELHPNEARDASWRIFTTHRKELERSEQSEPTTHVVVRSDGKHVPVEIHSSLVSLSGRPVLQGVFRDISAHQEAEALLRKEKEQAQTYLDVAGVAFIALDRDGRVTLINQRGLEILGYEHEADLIGRPWFDTCIPEPMRASVRAVFSQLMTGAITASEYRENPVVTKSGEQRTIAWHNTVLRDDHGAITGTLSSGEDITDQRTAEQERLKIEGQLRQMQKLEAIGTLASGVAHEINNPLTGIINYAQLIHDRTDHERHREYAQGIVDEGNRVARIVRNLLSFSRQEVERPGFANLEELVQSALSLIGSVLRKEQIVVTVEIAPDLPFIRCRAHQIEQVLLNLLTNARDALNERYPEYHPNKIVRISAHTLEREGASWIAMVIEDHGTGIPDEIRERIFDPFFSTKTREKGTGLGLSVSYGLVREHGGRILAESLPNAYTRFIVELPIDGVERSSDRTSAAP